MPKEKPVLPPAIEGYWYVIQVKDKRFSAYLASIDHSGKTPRYGFVRREELELVKTVSDIKCWVDRKHILRKAGFAQPKYNEMLKTLKVLSKTFKLKFSAMFESTKSYRQKVKKEEKLAKREKQPRVSKKANKVYKPVS